MPLNTLNYRAEITYKDTVQATIDFQAGDVEDAYIQLLKGLEGLEAMEVLSLQPILEPTTGILPPKALQ